MANKFKVDIRKAATKTIIGHHRSRKLAKKHLRGLGPDWKITSRRRADGHYSVRGHLFTFGGPETDVIWIVTVRLHSDTVEGEISRQREVDFIVRAPANATHGKLIKLILANKCTVRWTLGGPKRGERPADVWRWMTKTLGSDRRDIFGEPYCQVFFIKKRKP